MDLELSRPSCLNNGSYRQKRAAVFFEYFIEPKKNFSLSQNEGQTNTAEKKTLKTYSIIIQIAADYKNFSNRSIHYQLQSIYIYSLIYFRTISYSYSLYRYRLYIVDMKYLEGTLLALVCAIAASQDASRPDDVIVGKGNIVKGKGGNVVLGNGNVVNAEDIKFDEGWLNDLKSSAFENSLKKRMSDDFQKLAELTAKTPEGTPTIVNPIKIEAGSITGTTGTTSTTGASFTNTGSSFTDNNKNTAPSGTSDSSTTSTTALSGTQQKIASSGNGLTADGSTTLNKGALHAIANTLIAGAAALAVVLLS